MALAVTQVDGDEKSHRSRRCRSRHKTTSSLAVLLTERPQSPPLLLAAVNSVTSSSRLVPFQCIAALAVFTYLNPDWDSHSVKQCIWFSKIYHMTSPLFVYVVYCWKAIPLASWTTKYSFTTNPDSVIKFPLWQCLGVVCFFFGLFSFVCFRYWNFCCWCYNFYIIQY